MSPTFALAAKETRDILRERSIIVALVVQLFIAGFSTSLSIGLSGLYDPGTVGRFPPAQVAFDGTPELGALLGTARNLRVQTTASSDAIARFNQGQVDGVVLETVSNGTHRISLLIPDGGIQATLLLTQLRDLLQTYELQLRRAHQADLVHPVLAVEAPAGRSFPFGFVYATLLPLLVFTPVVLSGAIAGDTLVQEVQARTLGVLRSAPISVRQLLAGKLLAPIVLAPLQVLLWIGLFALNGIPVGHVGLILAVATLAAILMASLAAAIGLGVPRPSQAQAAYALVAILVVALSLLLPRDPMGLVARLATGSVDAASWGSLAWLLAAAAGAALLGLRFARRGLARLS